MSTADAGAGFGSPKRTRCSPVSKLRGLVLAVSGGPDSTALLVLAARWAKRLKRAPKLVAVTVDHGLRARSGARGGRGQAARRAGSACRIARCAGAATSPRPACRRRRARGARYRAARAKRSARRFAHIVTAHTLDDQAETVLFRLARGSGLSALPPWRPGTDAVARRARSFWCARCSTFPRRGSSRRSRPPRSPSPTIRPTAIRASRARGCAA